mmetsp:Transcript_64086/g.118061  ORF Transcript_64086/g.118061 Transcript_64086/m.118061 type:complete len:539 (+) Transcript_64086:99-1715(+)
MSVPTKAAGTPSLSSLQAALRKSSSPKPGGSPPEQGVKRSLSAVGSDGEPPAKRVSSAGVMAKPGVAKAPIVKTGGSLQGKSSGLSAKGSAPAPAVTGALQKAKGPGPPAKAAVTKTPAASRPPPPGAAVNGNPSAAVSKAPGQALVQDHTDGADMESDSVPAAIVGLVATINASQGTSKQRHLLRLADSLTHKLQIEYLSYFFKAMKKKLSERAQKDGVRVPASTSQSSAALRPAGAVKSAGVAAKPAIPVKKGPPGSAPPVKQAAVAKTPAAAPAPAVTATAAATPAPVPPLSPQSSENMSNDPLYALVGELTEDPVCQDGVLLGDRLNDVLQQLWNGVARTPKDWIAAWQALCIPVERQAEALQKFLNMAFVQTEGHEGEQAPMIVAELVKKQKMKLRSVEEVLVAFGHNLDGILAMNEEAWHVYAFFLTHIFPKPLNTGWGWSRVGWSWQSWWQFVEKCIESLEPPKAFDVIAMVLRLVQEREGVGLVQVPTWTEGERLKKVITKLGELGSCTEAEVYERLGIEGVVAVDSPAV